MIGYSLIQSGLVDPVKKSLLDERQELLDYKFAGIMTARQDERLETVRFDLDVIEDMRQAAIIETMKHRIDFYLTACEKGVYDD